MSMQCCSHVIGHDHSTAQRSIAWHSMAWHSMAQHANSSLKGGIIWELERAVLSSITIVVVSTASSCLGAHGSNRVLVAGNSSRCHAYIASLPEHSEVSISMDPPLVLFSIFVLSHG